MRAICLIICCFPFLVRAQTALEKTVSIHLDQVQLEEALSSLSAAASVEFSYSDDIVPVTERVSLHAENEALGVVLTRLLEPFQVEYKLLNGRIILRKAPAPLVQVVRGLIIDGHTHAPVPGANIIIVGSDPLIGTTTDADGKFKMRDVPVGRISIRISSVGYNSKTLSNMLLGTGKELVLEIPLAESITAMDEVVITPGMMDSDVQAEAPSSHVFTVEETKRYAGSLGDPARMASGYAGVMGASDESNALVVRGNSPRGVLWRVEGLEVPNPNHFATEGSSNGIVSVLSANIIDNSSFLTGAFPAMYGNALSAVFDMKLRNGNNEQREHSFQAGLLGLEVSTEGPFTKNHNSSYLINYRYSTLDILDKLGVDLNAAGEFKSYQDVAFKAAVVLPHEAQLSVFGIGGLSKSNHQTSNTVNRDQSDVGVTGLTFEKRFNNTYLTTSLSWSATHIVNENRVSGLSLGLLEVEENYYKSYVRSLAQASHRISDKCFIDGGIIYSRLYYDFYLRNLDPSNSTYSEIVNFSEQNTTAIVQGFASARHQLTPSLSAVYGMHYIHFKLTNDQSIEPRASLRWKVDNRKAFMVSFGKHSRIENLQYYLARDHQTGGNEVQINKNLGFTRANHFVLGYEQSFTGKHLLKVEGYYQNLYNAPVQSDPSSMYASINQDTGFITDTLINNGQGKNYGVEISLERPFAQDFYYLINGSLFQSRFRIADEAERNTSYNGNFNFHLLVGKEFKMKGERDALGLNLKITWAGGRRYIPIDLQKSIQDNVEVYQWDKAFEAQMPDYFRADVQFVYRRNKPRYTTEWRLDIQNVTDHINPAYYYYHDPSETIRLKNQVGFLPIISYRIEF